MLALPSTTNRIAAGACFASAENLLHAASGFRPPSSPAAPSVEIPPPLPALPPLPPLPPLLSLAAQPCAATTSASVLVHATPSHRPIRASRAVGLLPTEPRVYHGRPMSSEPSAKRPKPPTPWRAALG